MKEGGPTTLTAQNLDDDSDADSNANKNSAKKFVSPDILILKFTF